jgi:hypothetical protein
MVLNEVRVLENVHEDIPENHMNDDALVLSKDS